MSTQARTVAELAQRQAWSVGPEDTLETARRVLVERRLHWAPVLDGAGVVVGVLSAWDLLHYAAEGRPASMPVWQACTYRPVSVAPETTVEQAAGLLRDHKLHHLPIVAADGTLLGVVSSLDLLR